ncbi:MULTISPECIES: BlaI/MecI/CopY family transcriptional regulator [Elizabethkingia]|uniref:Penicillinase repressor n=3 Tax=Elizabethkingia anophelis TaxID=1117645 RepID=X5KKQ7_9FLAO|nr:MULTISPECIES: BlaI/MecI/CopY family transcriptional regulator [Elizabethkingia]AIL46368.1 Transcriptional regulator, MecI family [Elizabethkingia anophelis NUHP1]AQW96298.1 penicillinase repressor [Elizabethkingia anophelis]AQW96374.1 penicillinase repressor [Elizabethkingia anophelis]AQW99981.1 penicillinase repressor [Elizabethkingia anophelis]AQX52080.1 penicillinase repressor [Elizabethkingia anophelis]
MKSLTPAEETLMHALWTIERGFLKDIMEAYPEPKPHHNTVATVLKILVEKGFLKVKPFGRLHRYEVKVSKEQYYQQLLRLFIEEYYQASPELLLAEMIRLELLTDQHLKPYTKTNVTTESVSVKEEESKKSKPEKEKKKKKEKSKKKKAEKNQ